MDSRTAVDADAGWVRQTGGLVLPVAWINAVDLPAFGFSCGYCGHYVSSDYGMGAVHEGDREQRVERIDPKDFIARGYVCPHCKRVSFWFANEIVSPLAKIGSIVIGLPSDVALAYEESRRAAAAGAHTAAVMMCRKVLSHVAVEKGAKEGDSFKAHVDHLDLNHFIPPGGKEWVNYIRLRGNDANHELPSFERDEASHVIYFTSALLKFVYEMPSMMPKPPAH